MNRDVFSGWWKQARGQAKSWWGQLTDDELFECPFVMTSDAGTIGLSDLEAARLRAFLK